VPRRLHPDRRRWTLPHLETGLEGSVENFLFNCTRKCPGKGPASPTIGNVLTASSADGTDQALPWNAWTVHSRSAFK
jgi:hypothetical protein